MAYPSRPTFNGDFWYQIVLDDRSTWLCQTTGYEFIAQLQRTLRNAGIESATAYDGVSAGSMDVSEDLKWGPMTQRVLWLAALRAGLPASIRDAIAADGRAHRIFAVSVYAAIYVMMSLSASSGLFIESGTGPEIFRVQAFDGPTWNTVPAITTHGAPRDLTCTLQTPSPNPGVSTVPEPAPGELAQPAEPATPPPGTPRLPIPVGPPATTTNIAMPPAQLPTTVTADGISWGPILLGGGLLAAVGFIVMGLRRPMTAELPKTESKTTAEPKNRRQSQNTRSRGTK